MGIFSKRQKRREMVRRMDWYEGQVVGVRVVRGGREVVRRGPVVAVGGRHGGACFVTISDGGEHLTVPSYRVLG